MESVLQKIVPGYITSEATECSILLSGSCYDWMILPIMGAIFIICCLTLYFACEYFRGSITPDETNKKLVWAEDLEYGCCDGDETDDDLFESSDFQAIDAIDSNTKLNIIQT